MAEDTPFEPGDVAYWCWHNEERTERRYWRKHWPKEKYIVYDLDSSDVLGQAVAALGGTVVEASRDG